MNKNSTVKGPTEIEAAKDVKVAFTTDQENSKSEEQLGADVNNSCVVLLNVAEDEASKEQGYVREMINRIQKMRKTAKLSPTEKAVFYCAINPAKCENVWK